MGDFEDLMELADFSPVDDFYQENRDVEGLSAGFLFEVYTSFLLHYRPEYYPFENTTEFKFNLAVACIKGYDMIKEYDQLTAQDYSIFLVFACKGGSLDLVKYILSKFNFNPFNFNFLALKASVQHMDIIDHMYRYAGLMPAAEYINLVYLASYKNKNVVEYLLEKNPVIPELDIYFPHGIFKFLLKLPNVDAAAFLNLISGDEGVDHLSQNYLYLENFARKYPLTETKIEKLRLNKRIRSLTRELTAIRSAGSFSSGINHVIDGVYINDLRALKIQRDRLEEIEKDRRD